MASGDTLIIFPMLANEPPVSNYALFDTRNGHVVLEFSGTTNKSAVFSAVLPNHYDSGGVDVILHWAMKTATTSTVDWDVSWERVAGTNGLDSDSFASVQSANTETVPTTSGYVKTTTISFTDGAQMDSVAAGEAFRLKVTRDAASDASTSEAQLVKIEIKES
jgi:hypothetical protein